MVFSGSGLIRGSSEIWCNKRGDLYGSGLIRGASDIWAGKKGGLWLGMAFQEGHLTSGLIRRVVFG